MKGHKLIIESLHDGIAYCSCNHWYWIYTGEAEESSIRYIHTLHVLEEVRHEKARAIRERIEE